jgi:hypothetical protein
LPQAKRVGHVAFSIATEHVDISDTARRRERLRGRKSVGNVRANAEHDE